MKTGVIIEIKNNKAIVLESGGIFTTVALKPEYAVGDIITIKKNTINYKLITLIASCFIILLITNRTYFLFFKEISIVSIDINPSIELKLNYFDKIINAESFNTESKNIINSLDLKNKSIDDAMNIILNSKDMKPYINNESAFAFAVGSSYKSKEKNILSDLKKYSENSISNQYNDILIIYYSVDEYTIKEAHSHKITPGKYMLLENLKEVLNEDSIDEYLDRSVSEICHQIKNNNNNQLNIKIEDKQENESQNNHHNNHHNH